tara:strand:+ start:1146 stop:1394 length:249 start_codon:yes stop_codon:yes gene_type:complete
MNELNGKPTLPIHSVSGSYFDSNGLELKKGDVFEYTSKKWKSKCRIVERDGILGTIVTERDMPDKFIKLDKYLKRHYVTKVV